MLQTVFNNLITVTLTTSVIIVSLLILKPLFHKNYTAKWRYWLWLLLAVRLVIPFSPSLPQTPIAINPPSQSIEVQLPSQNVGFSEIANNASAKVSVQTQAVAQGMSFNEILTLIWLLGMLAFLIYQLIGYLLFKRSILHFSESVDNEKTVELFLEVKEQMNLHKEVRLLAYKKAISPMMTGFFKPIMLLPDCDYNDTDLKMIFKHEFIHFERKDIWYKLVLMLSNAVHWFNPLVYIMVNVANKDLEMTCDSEVIKGTDTEFRKQYSETILAAINKGNMRKTVFSTYFYGGKKTMKERFSNIFDMNKKKKGLLALGIIIALLGFAGTLVAYGATDTGKINNIALLDAGNSYYLENGKFLLSYNNGVTESQVPLKVDNDDENVYFEDKAIYVSDEITAVAYGGYDESSAQKSPVSVLISSDKGKTWNTYTVTDNNLASYNAKYIGFTNPNDGWLLLGSSVAMGHQNNRIFMTSSGGKSWYEIGNTSSTYARLTTGAGFINSNTGFVSFRYDSDPNPVVYKTQDKGKTWTQCSLKIPDSFKSFTSYATALSPVFYGSKGVLPVTFRNNKFGGDAVDVTVLYETSDYGKTWTFNEKYNMGLIWANAWETRDGKPRYEIMSSKMQKEFRTEQCSPDNPNIIYYNIRWSSPWVEDYDVAMDGEDAVITYWYTDSTQSTYKGVERLSFGKEKGRAVVTNCKTEVDMEEYADTSDWKTTKVGSYSLFTPQNWQVSMQNGEVDFMIGKNKVGSLTPIGYDSTGAISQFIGNHAEILSSKTIDGSKYPATAVIIKRTQPAAANDDSYVNELHIYLIPQNSKVAYDFNFDPAWGTQKAIEVAKAFSRSS